MLGFLFGLVKSRMIVPVLLVAVIGAMGWMLRSKHMQLRTATLVTDSIAAVADTTRLVAVDTWQRRALQAEIERDSLDLALDTRPVVQSVAQVQIDTVFIDGDSNVEVDEFDVRRVSFDVRQEPVTATVAVTVPPPPDTAHLNMTTTIDPIPINMHIVCSIIDDGGGVHAASVRVEGPPWADIGLENLVTEPDVCSPPLPGINLTFDRPSQLSRLVADVSTGALIVWMTSDGEASFNDYLLGAVLSGGIGYMLDWVF